MTRQQVINHVNNKHPDPNAMYQVVQAYHIDVLDQNWNPQQVNIMMLERAYRESLDALSRHHKVSLLFSKQKQFIKAL